METVYLVLEFIFLLSEKSIPRPPVDRRHPSQHPQKVGDWRLEIRVSSPAGGEMVFGKAVLTYSNTC